MDFPKIYLTYIPDYLMAVSNYELRLVFVFEICFRTVIPFIHQLPHWDAVDRVSSLFGPCLRVFSRTLVLIYFLDQEIAYLEEIHSFICQREKDGFRAFQATDSWWDWQELMRSWTWYLLSLGTSCAWENSLPKRSFGFFNLCPQYIVFLGIRHKCQKDWKIWGVLFDP